MDNQAIPPVSTLVSCVVWSLYLAIAHCSLPATSFTTSHLANFQFVLRLSRSTLRRNIDFTLPISTIARGSLHPARTHTKLF